MSSSSTTMSATAGGNAGGGEEFVPCGMLLVHVAENGHSLEFECDGSTPVEAILQSIERLCGIPVADQLLLCGNTSLEPHHSFAAYNLPQDGREVFLYNKSRLHADAPRPPPEAITLPEPQLPSPPSESQRMSHPLDSAADPALKALASYEHQFRYHFQLANAVYTVTQAKLVVCRRLVREQQVQERALETARGNLDHTYKKLQQRYTDFTRCFLQQSRCHSELLANLERDIKRLGVLKLHPELQSHNRKCLLDLVEKDKLRKWEEVCVVSHKQFEAKVSHLNLNFGELRKKAERVLSGMSSTPTKDLESAIKDHEKVLSDQKSIMQSLSKDVNTVKKLVDDCLSCQLSASLCPHDAVSALGPMYNVHERNHIPKVRSCDNAISKLFDKCMKKKNEMNSLIHVSMQTVKSVQFNIRDMMNELHAFQEVMGHQDKEFENLKFVHGIGHAYRACLAEVARRRSYLKLYMGFAGQLAERLAIERETEKRRRDEFFRIWSKYIPQDILYSMGLFESPSQCDVNIAPFDTNLLTIDIVDVDRLAPQSVVGLLSKYDGVGLPASCLATSGDRSKLSKPRESSLNDHDRNDSVEFLDGFDSVNIAGTNKVEVENAWLKAELASAIALICSLNAEIGYDVSDDNSKMDGVLKNVKEKTAEAIQLKDDYAKHLQSLLEMKLEQCSSYEKRIQELERRLDDQYMQGQKFSASRDASRSGLSMLKTDEWKSGISRDDENHMPFTCTIPMDEASSSCTILDEKLDHLAGHLGKHSEGADENMTDLYGTINMQSGESIPNMDSSMLELPRDEQVLNVQEHRVGNFDENRVGGTHKDDKLITAQLGSSMINSSSEGNVTEPLGFLPCRTVTELGADLQVMDHLVRDVQSALEEKSKKFDEVDSHLKAALEEINSLRKDLEISRNLLDESQMNCAHLENCLHEAREEAQTNLCAADRRASEYRTLRTTALKMHSLFEMFRSCVTAPVPIPSIGESLSSLANSFASSAKEDDAVSVAEFRICVKVLADKVLTLTRHRAELLEQQNRAEAAHRLLVKEFEDKNELIKTFHTQLQSEKLANKEKLSFGHLEVHDLAAFVLKAGHYEAISKNCLKYFLSSESVALFTEQHSTMPIYIIGQIVHIERQIVKPSVSIRAEHGDHSDRLSLGCNNRLSPRSLIALNPYNLSIGCEYFIVTIAMLADTILSNPS